LTRRPSVPVEHRPLRSGALYWFGASGPKHWNGRNITDMPRGFDPIPGHAVEITFADLRHHRPSPR
jgi:hypothetical protein